MAQIESKPTTGSLQLSLVDTVKIKLSPKDADGAVLDLTGATLDAVFARSQAMADLQVSPDDVSAYCSISGADDTGCYFIIHQGTNQKELLELVKATAGRMEVRLAIGGNTVIAGILTFSATTGNVLIDDSW